MLRAASLLQEELGNLGDASVPYEGKLAELERDAGARTIRASLFVEQYLL